VLDSEEEEAAREEDWDRAEAMRYAQRRRTARRLAEQAKRIREREARGTAAEKSAGNPTEALGYVRLVLAVPRRRSASQAATTPKKCELEAAFAEFEAHVVSIDAIRGSAVLAVAGGAGRALACALAFHGWPQRIHNEATQTVYRSIRVVVAPVTAGGRALAGPRQTIAASRRQVLTYEGKESRFL
jgi:hypothetical protein